MKPKIKTKKKKNNLPIDIDSVLPLEMLKMAKSVREDNKRWGQPLITWKNGKIFKIPTNLD